jgi:hypothetical protein
VNFTPRKKNTGPYPPKGVSYLPNIGQYSISCDFKLSKRLIFQQEASRDDWTLVWPVNPCFIPNLSVDRMGANWALFNESGNHLNRFAWFSSDNTWQKCWIWGAVKVQVRVNPKLGWNSWQDQVSPEQQFGPPFFYFSFSVHCFHTDFDFLLSSPATQQPQFGGELGGPVALVMYSVHWDLYHGGHVALH